MPRRLLILNAVLGLVSVAFAIGIVRTLLVKHPLPRPAAVRPAIAQPPPVAAGAPEPGPEAYAVIAAQNLFSPARSESAAAAAAAPPIAKPILHGVVIDGSKSRAFLEDPAVKRVSGYSVGDSVSGGRLQSIADDRVVIARPEGMMEVLLQDPSKPRPAPTPAGAPGAAGPGQFVPGQPGPGQPMPGQPGPGQLGPGQTGPGQFGQAQPGPGQFGPQVAPGQVVPVQVAPSPGVQPNQPQGIPSQNRRRLPTPGGTDQ